MTESASGSWTARWAGLVLRHPQRVAAFILIGIALSAAGALQIRLDFSSASFYGEDDRGLAELADFQDRFGPDDGTVAVLIQRSGGQPVATADETAFIAGLAERFEQLSAVDSVVTGTVRDLSKTSATARPTTQGLEQLRPLFASSDGSARAIYVNLRESTDDLGRAVPVVEELRAVLRQVPAPPGLHLELGGVPAIRAAFFGLTISDQLKFIPATLAIIGVGLFVAFGRLPGVVIPAAAAGLPVFGLVGIMGWVGEPIGLLNQAYFTLLPVLTIADAIHMMSRIGHEAHNGADNPTAIVRASGLVGHACLLTSVTTAVGFASLAFVEVPMLRNFGLFAALGIGLAFFAVITIVPLGCSRVSNLRPAAKSAKFAAWITRISRPAWHHPRLVLGVAAVSIVAAGSVASTVVVDNRLTDLLQPSHPVAQASAVIDRDLAGILSLEVELRPTDPETPVSDTSIGRDLAAFEAWARAQPEVKVVLGPALLPATHLRDGRARVSLRVADTGGERFGQLKKRVAQRIEAMPGLTATLTGTASLAYHGVNRIAADLRESLAAVFVIVTLLIGVLTRSLRLALISMIPNVMPLLLGYALLGVAGITLDPLAAVILAIALGVAVDDTIHMLVRFGEVRQALGSNAAAARQSVETTGTAIAITSLVLIAGLLINLGSSFPPLQMLGALGAVVIGLALACDLWVLPALLVVGVPQPTPALRTESEPPATTPR